jgi:hypothetical protein
MSMRIQVTIPEIEADNIFRDISLIAPRSRAIVGTTPAPGREDSKLLIVLTDDPDIEFMVRLKYAGCETHITRF